MKKWIFGMAALAAAMCFGATTEDGVTKERRGALGPNDMVVTDVDATGIVAARTYTKDEVDRRIATNAPVRSVNGKAGNVTLGAGDVGALPNNRTALEGNANFVNAVKSVQVVPTVRKVYTNGAEAVATPDGRIDLALPVAPSSKADRYDPNAEPSHAPFLFPSYYAMWLSFQDVYSWSRDHHRAINDRITQGDSETLAAAKRYSDQYGGAVKSVNGKKGEVVLDSEDVGTYDKATIDGKISSATPGDYLSVSGAALRAEAKLDAKESTWDGKQDAIDDLEEIRAGAAAGATALQEHQSLEPATNYTDSATNGIRRVDGAARMLPKYLHERSFDDSYPDVAEEYYRSRGDGKVDGGCSAVRDGGYLSRNFDFPFDDRAEFVVKMSAASGRFASVGVAQVGTNLTEQMVTSGKPSRWYKALPGATVDGINENGVVAEINVVDGEPPASTGGDIHPLGAVRWSLDNGTSAEMVATSLASRIQFPAGWKQNLHWMIADERATWIVENGTASNVTAVAAKRVMTNFPIIPDAYAGMGAERYQLLFVGEPITNAWYTRAYSPTANWASEFKSVEEQDAATNGWARLGTMEARRATGLFWQSVHTSIYDLANRVLRVAVQETDDWYTFAVPSAGGTDEAKVREIAETVVAPVASSVSGLQSSKLDKSDVIAPAMATTNGKAADARATKDALDSKANVPMVWYPNYIVIFDGDGNFVNGAASVEELMMSIGEKIRGSNPYGSGGVGWNDEAGFVFDACRVLIGYGSVLNAVSGDRIVFENDGNEETIDERIVRLSPTYTPTATDPTFSNAVLAVGLNIDTNSVAVLNEIAATFGGFPITGTATTVGGLLAALAAAVAWLRKNKIDKLKVTGMTAEATAENGVAKLDDFFKESSDFTPPTTVAGALQNSLLEKSIVLAVTENFADADTTAYGGQN